MKPNAQYPALHDEFKSLLNNNGMVQKVTDVTRENTLDLVASNIHEGINKTEVHRGISDHSPVITKISIGTKRMKQAPRKIRLYKKVDWIGLNQFVALKVKNRDGENVAETWNTIRSTTGEGMLKFIPTKMTKPKRKLPYISPDLEQNVALRNRLDQKSRETGKPATVSRYRDFKKQVRYQFWREYY